MAWLAPVQCFRWWHPRAVLVQFGVLGADPCVVYRPLELREVVVPSRHILPGVVLLGPRQRHHGLPICDQRSLIRACLPGVGGVSSSDLLADDVHRRREGLVAALTPPFLLGEDCSRARWHAKTRRRRHANGRNSARSTGVGLRPSWATAARYHHQSERGTGATRYDVPARHPCKTAAGTRPGAPCVRTLRSRRQQRRSG